MAGLYRRPRTVRHPIRLSLALWALTLLLTVFLAASASGEEATGEPGDTNEDDDTSEGEDTDDALSIDDLRALCVRLRDDSREVRQEAVDQIVAAGPSSLPAVRHRLRRELLSSPFDIIELLDRIAPDVRRQKLPPRDASPPFDILPPLIDADRDDPAQKRTIDETLEVVSLLRSLEHMETTEAIRVLIRQGTREHGAFRAEVARACKRLGDRAIPALLRTTQHPNASVAQLAADLLEWLRRTTPGRQVNVRDSATLAEILTIYGEIADRDSIPVLLSFSGSEVEVVREAARASVLRFGPAILWPARSKYENFTGESPRRSWSWEELARRLFEAQDRARMAQAERAFEEGLRYAQRREFEPMLDRFEAILSRWPTYERRAEMVPGLIAYADSLGPEHRTKARLILRRALLIDPDGERAEELRARLFVDNVERELERGVAVGAHLDRLGSLDPAPPVASELRTRVDRRVHGTHPRVYRKVAAGGLLLFAVALLGLLVARLFRKSGAASSADRRPTTLAQGTPSSTDEQTEPDDAPNDSNAEDLPDGD